MQPDIARALAGARCGRRCDTEFAEILAAGAGLPDAIVDGEVVVFGDDGAPDFTALRTRPGATMLRGTSLAPIA